MAPGLRPRRRTHIGGVGARPISLICSWIAGAAGRTYLVRRSDQGRRLRVRVTASNRFGARFSDSAFIGPVTFRASIFMSPSGDDLSCIRYATRAPTTPAACRSLQATVSRAQPGDIIQLAAGTYLWGNVNSAKPAPGVTIVLPPTGSVRITDGFDCDACAGITILGDPNSLGRLSMPTFHSSAGSRVTLRYATLAWDGNSDNSSITDGSDSITIDHNDLSATNCGNLHINTHIQTPSRNVRITNNLFHDFMTNPGCHSEAIWMAAVEGGELSGNRFERVYGNTANVFLTTTDGDHCFGVSGLRIEHNWFGATSSGSGYGMQFGNDPGCENPHHHLTFEGNCWQAEALWETMSESQTASPGTSISGEYGRLSPSSRTAALALGVAINGYPFKPLARCPLRAS